MTAEMEKRKCSECGRLYSEGPLIVGDWPYWDRSKDRVICPECRGIDVVAEMEAVIQLLDTRETMK